MNSLKIGMRAPDHERLVPIFIRIHNECIKTEKYLFLYTLQFKTLIYFFKAYILKVTKGTDVTKINVPKEKGIL